MTVINPTFSVGSVWRRWEPHIHVPGTLLEDQYTIDIDEFCRRVTAARPVVEAVCVTEYYVLDSFYKIEAAWRDGKLPNVRQLLPNIELRVNGGATPGTNVHLIVSTSCGSWREELGRCLQRLTLPRPGNTSYNCERSSLVLYGKAILADSNATEKAALMKAAESALISVDDLENFARDEWVQQNILIAVANSTPDGLSELNASPRTHGPRDRLARAAHAIFSGNSNDRRYWLNSNGDVQRDGIGVRPCLHGSDAHKDEEICNPDMNRYCWIRGDLTFDGLRQTLVEPERRVWIGETPPDAKPKSSSLQTILATNNVSWLSNPRFDLNDGFVAIIGEKGSGKTALADLIALGLGAIGLDAAGQGSFLARAKPKLEGLVVETGWRDGRKDSTPLTGPTQAYQRKQGIYLSQHFVESLTSSDDAGDKLRSEIDRIAFEHTSLIDRNDAHDFASMRDKKEYESAAAMRVDLDAIERANLAISSSIASQVKAEQVYRGAISIGAEIVDLERETAAVVGDAGESPLRTREIVAQWQRVLSNEIAQRQRDADAMLALRGRISAVFEKARVEMEEIRTQFSECLTELQWSGLLVHPPPAVLAALDTQRTLLLEQIESLRTHGSLSHDCGELGWDELQEIGRELDEQIRDSAGTMERRNRLEQNLDTKRREFATHWRAYNEEIASVGKMAGAVDERRSAFERLFRHLGRARERLTALYVPMLEAFARKPRLRQIGVRAYLRVDWGQWIEEGEALLDKRRGPFPGIGKLGEAVREQIIEKWNGEDADQLGLLILEFATTHFPPKPDAVALVGGRRVEDFARWLYSVTHITAEPNVTLNGTALQYLSPGTRGALVLKLFMEGDHAASRPIIIDQPEENLDPRTVQSELVSMFRDAAKRRQVVLVTHNANLVVNGDADQVVIATSASRGAGTLPVLSYLAGSIEDQAIRAGICDILEGGEAAFRKRDRTYRRLSLTP
jgi:hypothetical protein